MAVQCKIEIPTVHGLKEAELTVGREFYFICEGEFAKTLEQEKLQFKLKPEEKYQIHLLGFEFRSPTQADIKVTAYKAGNFQYQDLVLSDGSQDISLGKIEYQVQSVLPPAAPGQEAQAPQPFGPIGPAQIGVPDLYWIFLISLVALVIARVAYGMFRVIQRRRLLERLKEHDSALSPLAQFHQSLRKVQRVNTVFFGGEAQKEDIKTCVLETEKAFKLFLTRQFQMPALEWNDKLILKNLKKYHRKVFNEYQEELKSLLNEYSRARKDIEKVSSSDALHITQKARILVERMEAVK